jgi:hypothetical protein
MASAPSNTLKQIVVDVETLKATAIEFSRELKRLTKQVDALSVLGEKMVVSIGSLGKGLAALVQHAEKTDERLGELEERYERIEDIDSRLRRLEDAKGRAS